MVRGIGPALLLVLTGACEMTNCTPTSTAAQDASIVVAPNAAKSGVLVATLTTGDATALAGKKITFSVDDALVGSPTLGSDVTDARGRARLDLKGRPLQFVKTVNQDDYTAAFAGDSTYCSSSDTAVIDIARVG